MFQITGTLKSKQSEQQVSDKFRKREFVITENSSQYPQMLSFQLTQDRCSLIEGVNAGDEIKVHFNLRGREWTSPQGEIKYFNSLEAWKIESNKQSNNGPQVGQPPVITESLTPSEPDDLPF
jgi:hypothetical protein